VRDERFLHLGKNLEHEGQKLLAGFGVFRNVVGNRTCQLAGDRKIGNNDFSFLRRTIVWLESLRSASIEEQLLSRVARRGTEGLPIQPLITKHRLLQVPGDILLASEAFEAASESTTSVLKREQTGVGLKRAELKTRTSLSAEVFAFVLERLGRARRLRFQGELVCPAETDSRLSNLDAESLSAIAAIYRKAGLSAPLTSEVATTLKLKESEMRRLATLLLRGKILIRMGSKTLFVHSEALERLRTEISKVRGQTLDLAHFKQMTGLSRNTRSLRWNISTEKELPAKLETGAWLFSCAEDAPSSRASACCN